MSRIITQARETFLLWRLFYIKAGFSSLVTLGASWQLATANIAVQSLDKWELFSLSVGIFVLWGNNMISLLDKTAAQVQRGQLFDDPATALKDQKENG